jgi:uncharacterized membrane protein
LRARLLAAAVVAAGTLGNFALSWGMKHNGGADLLASLLHPAVITGIVILILWQLLRATLFTLADLAFVLPVTSIGYALNAVMGWALLEEQIPPQRAWGIVLITLGAALAGLTAPKEKPRERPNENQ